MSTSTIRHIIVMPRSVTEENTSFFQGFSRALLPEYIDIFDGLKTFPKDVMEPWLTSEQLALSKIFGSSLDIYMLRVDLIDSNHLDFDRDFNVLWSTETDVDEVSARINQFDIKPIHISTCDRENVVLLGELTQKKANDLVAEIFSRAAELNPDFSDIYRTLKKTAMPERDLGCLPFIAKMHNCTMPLLDLVQFLGYKIDQSTPIIASGDSTQHINSIAELVGFIDNNKIDTENYSDLRKNDAIIFCPSIYAMLYKTDSRLWNNIHRELDSAKRNFIKSAIARNKGYGNFNLQTRDGFFNPTKGLLGFLMLERKMELEIFTSAISIASTNQLAPAIRLPHATMLHHAVLGEIYSLINSNRRDRKEKLNKKFSEYSRLLIEDIGEPLLSTAFQSREKLLTICDFPIEWLSIHGTPLMFSHEVSRIPSTPGNVTISTLLSGQRIAFPLSLCMKVLIIRSFKPNDPIREHLTVAIEGFSQLAGLDNLTITWADVSSEKELVDSLNNFDGLTVIFDCHGNHGGQENNAWLNIGDEKVSVWEMSSTTRVPPIVILAACSTHPLGGSHASVANGFLKSGAKSVVGTFAPVDSVHTGVTVARILYRMSKYLPIKTRNAPCSWRKVMSGFFRMSYITDILRDLHGDAKLLSEDQSRRLGIEANVWINSEDPEWLQKIKASIHAATKLDEVAFSTMWHNRNQFVDTMLLVQMGHPEDIMVYNDIDTKEKNKIYTNAF
ncbi:hypothetical protein ALQ62_01752 [Pseudomonas coronafaciens pv. zizaniae]|uniref:hypothetical protein n=1 Tax=Pseudomonas coronafaciens TaxID=53409 RepID=UPI000EFEE204|nr:hypothetical protein [Pseudomonas coronafaciens]RMN27166.1 hypothetical protein ALQ62_01752 [Pseudomonas coronafaciens pv. zizaniae]